MKSVVVAVLLAIDATSSAVGSSGTVAAAASPSPAVTPTKLSVSDLSRTDAAGRATLPGRDVIVSGFVGDLLIVNNGHDARRVLRIVTSPRGAGIVAGCVAYDRDDFDHRLRGAIAGASVSLEG